MSRDRITVREVQLQEIAAMRKAFRVEMNCQVVHDSIHFRRGWTREFEILEGDERVAYASLAVGGPWRDKPAFYEFYVIPERRSRAYALFDAVLSATQPPAFEVQSSDVLTTTMALTFARDVATDRVIFRNAVTTTHVLPGAILRCVTALADIQSAIVARQGGGEWLLEMNGTVVGKGGILFHYNPPYGDVYMEIDESFRRGGYGSYLVQELKRLCYELGAVPAARCQPTNRASQRTLQRAGMVPFAQILTGAF